MTLFLPPLPPKWEAALRDVRARDPKARVAAADRLARAEAEQRDAAVAGLLVLCTDADVRVRASAIAGLGEFEDARALPALVRTLSDADATVRELACVSIGRAGYDTAHDALFAAATSPHAEVRYHVASALGDLVSDARTPPALTRLLADSDARVRANAAQASASLPPSATSSEVRAALLRMLDDTDGGARGEAAITLARSGEARACDALVQALERRDLVLDALDAAPTVHDPRITAAVATLAKSVLRPRMVVAAAGRALLRSDPNDVRGVEALRAALTALQGDGRTYAVQVAGELEVLALTPELSRLTLRPRGVDPMVLAETLAALAPESAEARAALAEFAARDDEVGAFSHAALSRLVPPAAPRGTAR